PGNPDALLPQVDVAIPARTNGASMATARRTMTPMAGPEDRTYGLNVWLRAWTFPGASMDAGRGQKDKLAGQLSHAHGRCQAAF
ncbi:hypothetical protein, partial [Rhodovulum sulfidophilum]|uniref:hypothetical protein n=1 Tax=Rhodovulum sulfidophilum TaxID=35806 RepID=UPI001F349AFD